MDILEHLLVKCELFGLNWFVLNDYGPSAAAIGRRQAARVLSLVSWCHLPHAAIVVKNPVLEIVKCLIIIFDL